MTPDDTPDGFPEFPSCLGFEVYSLDEDPSEEVHCERYILGLKDLIIKFLNIGGQ